ncbi:MAG TPA: hypothetical protein VGI39_05930 [Polyangiaceae bacterium]|jgi:hypothetical protein
MLRPLSVLALATSLLPACSSSSSPSSPPASCNADALVVVSDYTSSGVGHLALDGTGFLQFGTDLAADPMLATSAGRAFFLARDLGKIYELDPHCGTPTGTVFNANDAAHQGSANPQDVAVAPDGSLWIPRYNVPSVLQLSAKGDPVRSIDLSPYAPDMTNPDATAIDIEMVSGQPKAFVTLERLDNSQPIPVPYPDKPSQILRIDVTSGQVEGTTDLVGRNPFGGIVSYGGALWLAEPGDFASATEMLAGIERFDPQTATSALRVKETDLGGSVSEVAVTGGCGAAIVADASANNLTSLVTFDPQSGAVLANASSPVFGPTSGFNLEGMLWVGNVLLVGDRGGSGGQYAVHAFDLTAPCSLKVRTDTIFLKQAPIALRAVK